jgi:hypothetical protein
LVGFDSLKVYCAARVGSARRFTAVCSIVDVRVLQKQCFNRRSRAGSYEYRKKSENRGEIGTGRKFVHGFAFGMTEGNAGEKCINVRIMLDRSDRAQWAEWRT